MINLLLFNKPYGVVTQFSGEGDTLKNYISVPGVYAAGRLDKDSEGLLVLSDHGPLIAQISQPRYKMPKTYWVQVEGTPHAEALSQLQKGVLLKDGMTKPAEVRVMEEPENLWPRMPPIRFRASIPTTWLEITIREGRNRQVRRMTAAVGLPTLRLIRYRIGAWTLDGLASGQWRQERMDRLFL